MIKKKKKKIPGVARVDYNCKRTGMLLCEYSARFLSEASDNCPLFDDSRCKNESFGLATVTLVRRYMSPY
jgi:hypothetical protein